MPALSSEASFFTSERRATILDHMNGDHADAVLGYARHFAGRATATAARLTGIDRTGIDLSVSEPSGENAVRIDFNQPLATPDDAHRVLVDMARAVKQPAGDSALGKARAAAAGLAAGLRTAILGTVSAAGEPDASVAPVVRSADGTLHTYVSDMSTHTKNLRETGRASVLIIEDEAAAEHLLGRKRLTLPCAAAFVERDTPAFAAAMTALKEKFGPVMRHLEGMTDFHLVRLEPAQGRLVAGFGQAFAVDPADWSRLSPLGGGGHTPAHAPRKS